MLTQIESNGNFQIADAAYLARSSFQLPEMIEAKHDRANNVELLRRVPPCNSSSSIREF